ncbi:unnamed protein product [Prunus armeniaca]
MEGMREMLIIPPQKERHALQFRACPPLHQTWAKGPPGSPFPAPTHSNEPGQMVGPASLGKPTG